MQLLLLGRRIEAHKYLEITVLSHQVAVLAGDLNGGTCGGCWPR